MLIFSCCNWHLSSSLVFLEIIEVDLLLCKNKPPHTEQTPHTVIMDPICDCLVVFIEKYSFFFAVKGMIRLILQPVIYSRELFGLNTY